MIPPDADVIGAAAGATGATGLVGWLLKRLIEAKDNAVQAALLRLEGKLDTVEARQADHGETLAVLADRLNVTRKERRAHVRSD